jgi:hypothetical protein
MDHSVDPFCFLAYLSWQFLHEMANVGKILNFRYTMAVRACVCEHVYACLHTSAHRAESISYVCRQYRILTNLEE